MSNNTSPENCVREEIGRTYNRWYAIVREPGAEPQVEMFSHPDDAAEWVLRKRLEQAVLDAP